MDTEIQVLKLANTELKSTFRRADTFGVTSEHIKLYMLAAKFANRSSQSGSCVRSVTLLIHNTYRLWGLGRSDASKMTGGVEAAYVKSAAASH